MDLVCTHLDYFVNRHTPYNLKAAGVITRVLTERRRRKPSAGAIIAGDMGGAGGQSSAVTHWVDAAGFQPASTTNNRHGHANAKGDWMVLKGPHTASNPDVFSSNGTSDHNILVFNMVVKA
jgi:hypothetical protein